MRRISKLFAAAALVFFACSCTEDLGPADLPVDDNRTLVTFNIRTPAPVRPATRVVDTAFESGIVNVVVLVAKDNGSGTFYLDQMIVVDEFRSSTSASAAFTVALTPDAARTKLLLVANCTSGALNTLNSFVARNYSESDLRIQLSDQLMQSVYGASGRMMTMTGEVTLESLSPAGMIDVEVPLVRFVARADVQVNLAAGSPTFEPAEMFVYNMHAFARIFPDPGAFAEPDLSRVASPSMPEQGDVLKLQVTGGSLDPGTGFFNNVYLPESPAPTTTEGRLNSATCIVVGGRYNGADAISYYRIDFNSGEPGHPFGQILRNHRYIFDITRVSSPGYPTADLAAANPSGAIRVEVTAWSERFSQLQFPDRSERKVSVLSLSDGAGTMGVWYEGGATAPAGSLLRRMLLNGDWFGPGGTVDFAGFTFDEFGTDAITASSPANPDRLARALESTDILVVPYANNPDQATCDLILDWLSDPHHVMFMSCDAGMDNTPGEATNVTLRNSLNDGLTWHSVGALADQTVMSGFLGPIFDGLLAIVGLGATKTTSVDGLMTADPTEANHAFTNGPFGAADQTQIGHGNDDYRLWDQTGEWAVPSDGSRFVPLAVFRVTATATPPLYPLLPSTSTTQKTGMSMLGVDPSRRIVYLGKSEFVDDYLRSVPQNPVGEALNPRYSSITTLMCNTWAWAVETALGN